VALKGPFIDFVPEPDGEFTAQMRFDVEAPANHLRPDSGAWPVIFWYNG
jgi:peroxiredoxin